MASRVDERQSENKTPSFATRVSKFLMGRALQVRERNTGLFEHSEAHVITQNGDSRENSN